MEKIRLSKRMSELGLCSRREADSYIEKGWVEVDGEIVSELGSKVYPTQKVILRSPAQNTQQQRVTYCLTSRSAMYRGRRSTITNRRSPCWTARHTGRGRSVTAALSSQPAARLAPAGRLDIDSQGLLVLTPGWRIAKQLIGEDSNVDKEYLGARAGQLDDSGLALLNQGLKLDGVYLKPAKSPGRTKTSLRFVLREGKRSARSAACASWSALSVTGLKRIRIGKVKLGNLPVGQWRYLGPEEKF